MSNCTRTAWIFVALGFALRLSNLSNHSLWYDEAATIYVATSPDLFAELVRDNHPPLNALLFRVWTMLFGLGDSVSRLIPALASCASLLLFARLTKSWLRGPAAVIAIAVLAVSPFHIWYGQEVRMYPFVEFFTVAALLTSAGWIERTTDDWKALTALFLSCTLAVGFHYLGALCALSVVSVFLLAMKRGELSKSRTLKGLSTACLGVLAWTPWFFLVTLQQTKNDWGVTGSLSWRSLAELPIRHLVVDASVIPEAFRLIGFSLGLILLVACGAGLWFATRQKEHPGFSYAAACFAVPVLATVIVSASVRDVFQAKYLIAASLGSIMTIAIGLASIPNRHLRTITTGIALVSLLSITGLQKVGNRREDYRAACASLAAQFRAGDIACSVTGTPAGFSEMPLRVYLRDRPSILDSIVSPDQAQKGLLAGQRLHVVYRSASYSLPILKRMDRKYLRHFSGPDRFRIQHIVFEPKLSADKPSTIK